MTIQGYLKVAKKADGFYYFEPFDNKYVGPVKDMASLNEYFYNSKSYVQLGSFREKDFKKNLDGTYSIPAYFDFVLETTSGSNKYSLQLAYTNGGTSFNIKTGTYTEIKNFIAEKTKGKVPALKTLSPVSNRGDYIYLS